MKKLIALVLSLVCVFALAGCNKSPSGAPSVANGEYFFTAKVVGVIGELELTNEGTYHEKVSGSQIKALVVEVVDSGNSTLSAETVIEVSANVTSADGCPDFIAGEYARIVFNGEVMEKNPPTLGEIFKIYKTDETGLSMAD